ncbi:hypothetical protein [Azospirillum doebereinerae]
MVLLPNRGFRPKETLRLFHWLNFSFSTQLGRVNHRFFDVPE